MKLRNFTLFVALIFASTQVLTAATLKGIVVDESTGEPLLGATVMVKGTAIGTATSFDGSFELKVDKKSDPLVVSYISYVTKELVAEGDTKDLHIKLAPDNQVLASVQVVTRANTESEVSLQAERMTSNVAIENIGIKEMSLKGLSNAEDGVKKMTGVSIAGAGQVIVRGLGDRYSITTLNGQPIASPNPDNKLIPLDIFPSSAISSIQVSKVYDAKAYADYAGAHIDITTKNNVYSRFFEVGVSLGGNSVTTGQKFYQMDNVSLLSKSSISDGAAALTNKFSEMGNYINKNDVFETDFSIEDSKALPKMAANVAWGNNYEVGDQKLTVMATAAIDNDYQTIEDALDASLRADGSKRASFNYNSYKHSLKLAGLATAGLTLREKDFISYTLFYARNAEDEFQDRRGWTYDVSDLVGISSVSNVYGMINNQIHGEHYFGEDWGVNYNVSYSSTSSDEPDRRQVMYTDNKNGTFEIFKEDQNETMRYFAELKETDLNGQFATDYKFGEENKNKLTAGLAYKTKSRDFDSMNFYYDYDGNVGTSGFDTPTINDVHDTSFLTNDNIGTADGQIMLTYERYPNDYYSAYSNVLSAFASVDVNFSERLLLTAGLRLESSEQSVDYGTEGRKGLNSTIQANDIFPALNLRYKMGEKNQLRFAASRTITRPSFVEMAPFSYEPSYGSGIIKGNADIKNAYNYNVDLRYEMFFERGDMFSATVYYKYLDTPIERIQLLSTTDPYTSFDNANQGMAAGLELEFRKAITETLRLSANAAYLLTNVNLAEGSQTNDNRMLQGASPYLVNVDLAYSPKLNGEQPLSLVLLYNLRGERIHSVGVDGLGDVMEKASNELNFVASYKLNDKMSIKVELENLLNQDFVCEQIVPQNNDARVEVERYEVGLSGTVGFSMKF